MTSSYKLQFQVVMIRLYFHVLGILGKGNLNKGAVLSKNSVMATCQYGLGAALPSFAKEIFRISCLFVFH